MHGTIFAELERYAVTKLGAEGWPKLLGEAGLSGKHFDPLLEHPDADALAIVEAACRITGHTSEALLIDFGEFIAPSLLKMYWSLIDSSWRTLDVVENADTAIHEVVRLSNPGARPPSLECERRSDDEVVLTYRSQRRMCALAKGIARGLATHYGERIEIEEPTCMLRGDAVCQIWLRRIGDGSGGP